MNMNINKLTDNELLNYYQLCKIKALESSQNKNFFKEETINCWIEIEKRDITSRLLC